MSSRRHRSIRLIHWSALLVVLLLAVHGWSQQAVAATEALPSAPTPQAASQVGGSVTGIVTDASGAMIPGARVVLTPDAPPNAAPLATVSGSEGQYSFAGVPAGPFHLTVTAPGFASHTTTAALAEGQALEVPDLALTVSSNSNVQVTASRTEIAQAEIDVEEHQRVLGFIPNFYVSYVPNPEPLDAKQKYELAWKTIIDPVTFLATGAVAGIQQATNSFPGYGQGASGYGKRYAAGFGDQMFGNMIGGAILPALFHQDPRYYYKGTGTTRQRILYALANTVVCKGDNGKWQFNYSAIGGGLAAGAISNVYYPHSSRSGWGLTFENAGYGILGGAIGNLFQEFLVKKLTPHVPNYSQTPAQ